MPEPRDRSEVDALKASIDLAAFIEDSGVPLRRVGQNLLGRCPFHEDAEASLSVNPERRLFNCFGCQTGGDVVTFARLKEGLSFAEALQRLRAWSGAASHPNGNGSPHPSNGAGSAARETPGLTAPLPGGFSRSELLGRVADLYTAGLHASRPAQEYLAGRGLGSKELWDAFRIGFADGSLLEKLSAEGELREALTALGVLTAKGREHFSGCVVLPLQHPDHGVIGLYGRKIDPRAKILHLYLPGPKRGALNWQALKASHAVWIAESVFDAMSLWSAGCRDVTCLFGVQGIPPDLGALLGRFGVREVRFCLDGDPPGRDATKRLSAVLSQRGIRCVDVALPDGRDPNQVLVEAGAAKLRELAHTFHPLGEAADSAAVREETGDGFVLQAGDVRYQVTPKPPFEGRLRVLLRATRGERFHVDNLDLFSHRARATSIAQIQRGLEISKEHVERHFVALIEETERWVAAFLQAREEQTAAFAVKPPPAMTAAEREEALEFLRHSDLVSGVLEDMDRLDYVGEERSKLLAYLIGVSRKLERPLSGVVVSQSAAGKSTLTGAAQALTPPEEVVQVSRLTPQALGYMPKEYLKHKLLIIEERAGGQAADYSLRVLQSQRRLVSATVVKDPQTGRMTTIKIDVEGPIAYLETTTDPAINHENATRCFELGLDESEEQTRRIHERQRQSRTLDGVARRERSQAICDRHHRAQRLLEPVRVIVGYVHHLRFPARWLRTRRDHERFLCLLETIAFLHQHQRVGGTFVEDGVTFRYVEATSADYRLAYDLAREVLGATLHELSRDAQELMACIRALVAEMGGGGDPSAQMFTRRVLRSRIDWHDKRLRAVLQELVEMEYLAAVSGSQGRTYHYRLLAHEEGAQAILAELTTPDELDRILGGG